MSDSDKTKYATTNTLLCRRAISLSNRWIEGFAIVYDEVTPSFNEKIAPDAFNPLGKVDMNLQHDPDIIIKRDVYIFDDGVGLRVRTQLPEDNGYLKLIKRGSLNGLSIEFIPELYSDDSSGVRTIEKGKLVGVALVDQAAYPSAGVTVRHKPIQVIRPQRFVF